MPRAQPTPSLAIRYRALAGSPLGRILARLAMLSALILIGGVVMRQARAQAYRLQDLRLGPQSIVFEGLPIWADARLRSVLQHKPFLPLDISVFDPRVEARVRAVLARHPLVRRVDDVRVLYPRTVRVKVTLREPACFVATHRKGPDGKPLLLLLSHDAQRLDEHCYAGYLAQRTPLPVLIGVDRGSGPTPGVPWDNMKEQVAEGLEAARVADRLARDLAWGRTRWVARIDVSRFPSPGNRLVGEVLLGLSDGTQVDWGRTERDLSGAQEEEGYERKMIRLMEALRSASTPGRPRGRIDVRFPPDPALPR
jgi:hypothetical protein